MSRVRPTVKLSTLPSRTNWAAFVGPTLSISANCGKRTVTAFSEIVFGLCVRRGLASARIGVTVEVLGTVLLPLLNVGASYCVEVGSGIANSRKLVVWVWIELATPSALQ